MAIPVRPQSFFWHSIRISGNECIEKDPPLWPVNAGSRFGKLMVNIYEFERKGTS